jgi:hypothetical protein
VKFSVEGVVDYYRKNTKKVAIETFKRAIRKLNESLRAKAEGYLREAMENSRRWLVRVRVNERHVVVN